MGNPIVHFEIRSTDPDASRAFYGELFGWTLPARWLPGLHVRRQRRPAGTIPGGISPTQGGSPLVTVFAGVRMSRRRSTRRCPSAARSSSRRRRHPGVTFGLFADPQGHVVGVASNDG